MLPLQPRTVLPDQLVGETSCPVCKSFVLQVLHLESIPDQVVCGECEAVYEISDDGKYGRLVSFPKKLNVFNHSMLNVWMSGADLHRLVDEQRTLKKLQEAGYSGNGLDKIAEQNDIPVFSYSPASDEISIEIPPEKPSPYANLHHHIITVKLRELYDSFHAQNEEQFTKISAQADRIRQIAKQRQKNQKNTLWLLAGLSLILLGVVVFQVIANNSLQRVVSMLVTPQPQTGKLIPNTGHTPSLSPGMSPEAQRYFAVLWEPDNRYAQKAANLAAVQPPAEISTPAAAILEGYRKAGQAEEQQELCLKSGESCARQKADLAQAQADLNRVFLKECPVLQVYYQKLGETWPFPEVCGD